MMKPSIFGVLVGVGGFFGVITRGIKLVVGRVNDWVLGVLGVCVVFLGGQRWSNGGLFYPP